MNDRNTIISFIANSREATRELSSLMAKEELSLSKVQACLERGALIEEATYEAPDTTQRDKQTRVVPAITAAFKQDRDDIVRAFYTASSVDNSFKDNWLESACFSRAHKSVATLIELGALQKISKKNRDKLLHGSLVRSDHQTLSLLLKAGCDPNGIVSTYGDYEDTILHAVHDSTSLALMLSYGAHIDGVDNRGRPPLDNVIERLGDKHRREEKRNEALVQTAHALLDAGSPVVLPEQNGHQAWRAVQTFASERVSEETLMTRLAHMDPEGARQARIHNIEAAHHLLVSGVITNLDQFSKNIWWYGIEPRGVDQVYLETLLERGVPAPRIFDISYNYHRAWLEIGIAISPKQLSKKFEQIEEDQENGAFENWSGLEEENLVAQSNSLAQARALRVKTAPANHTQPRKPRL